MHKLKPLLIRVIPMGLIVGAGMEFFMIKTGFYDIVTKNEAERRQQNNVSKLGWFEQMLEDKGFKKGE
jgi:hypothetical protein